MSNRLGNCPRCGIQLTDLQFVGGSIEGPPEDGWRTFEREPSLDQLHLSPCGCTLAGDAARDAFAEIRARMKRGFIRIRGWGMVPSSPACTVLTVVDTEKGWYTAAPVDVELLDTDPHAAESVYGRLERWMRHNTASVWYDRLDDVVRP